MYVEEKTGKILSLLGLQMTFANVSFPRSGPDHAFLDENGFDVLSPDIIPEIEHGQSLSLTDKAELIDGKWVRIINVVGDPIPEETAEPPQE